MVVAHDLSPSLTATLPRERILGIVLEGGSPTAHAAILARAYGIPAVVGAPGVLAALEAAGSDAGLAIDGGSGEVVVAPDEAAGADWDDRAARHAASRSVDLEEAALPAVTPRRRRGHAAREHRDAGRGGRARDAGRARRGAVPDRVPVPRARRRPRPRTSRRPPTAAAVEAFGGDPVTIRLLDIGGDKPIPYLPLPPEDNPFLGVRALRLAVDRPELFVTQLRACVPGGRRRPGQGDGADGRGRRRRRAAARPRARRPARAWTRTASPRGDVDLGVMLEIPSAILAGDAYFGSIAFASLGTNDLTQYALAVDRGNPALERYRDAMHPAVLRLIALAVEAADRAGIALSVCGEMGGDPAAALALRRPGRAAAVDGRRVAAGGPPGDPGRGRATLGDLAASGAARRLGRGGRARFARCSAG